MRPFAAEVGQGRVHPPGPRFLLDRRRRRLRGLPLLRRDQIIPVGLAALVFLEVQLQPLQDQCVDLDLAAEQGHQFDLQAELFDLTHELLGDAGKARKKLRWTPSITLEQLIAEMIETDLKEAQKDYLCQQEGFQTFNHFDT